VLNNKEINHFINKYLNNTTYKAQINATVAFIDHILSVPVQIIV